MGGELPEFYYRLRDNGALVFRIDTGNRNRRIEMEQIASVNIRSGEIKPQAGRALAEAEVAEIERWIAERRALLEAREFDDILRTVDHLNLTTQWAQSRATPEDLEMLTDVLLLAMHDLRAVLVRKKADRLTQE